MRPALEKDPCFAVCAKAAEEIFLQRADVPMNFPHPAICLMANM
jgi:hypothetical protein